MLSGNAGGSNRQASTGEPSGDDERCENSTTGEASGVGIGTPQWPQGISSRGRRLGALVGSGEHSKKEQDATTQERRSPMVMYEGPFGKAV